MTATVPRQNNTLNLEQWHQKLRNHFMDLRGARTQEAHELPVFALEHNLRPDERHSLEQTIHEELRTGNLSTEYWLPYIVYAAEIGYTYTGEDYWPTFESKTPRWETFRNDGRIYIRDQFQRFAAQFHGAKPTGRWAEHFSIICWPITHAVVPTNLQNRLLDLIHRHRNSFIAEFQDDPAELGRRLATHLSTNTSQFQMFEQNNAELLGQIVAAFLIENPDTCPYLAPSTIRRIIEDVKQLDDRNPHRLDQLQKAARAQKEAMRVKGLDTSRQETTQPHRDPITETPARISLRKPRLYLEKGTDPAITNRTYKAWIDLPNGRPLQTLHEELYTELQKRRVTINGQITPRGRLVYDDFRFRLDNWPTPSRPLVLLESAASSADHNRVLAENYPMPDGPPWLFRDAAGMTPQILSKTVRPNQRYVLISPTPLTEPSISLPAWIQEGPTKQDLAAWHLQMPAIVNGTVETVLETLGLSSQSELSFAPTGFAPRFWDNDGSAEYTEGEHPIFRVSSNRDVGSCRFSVDGEKQSIEWPPQQQALYIQVPDLEVGSHQVLVELFDHQNSQPLTTGRLHIQILDPPRQTPAGTIRQGLVIRSADLMNPTLPDLWDRKTAITIDGPPEVEVEMQLALSDRRDEPLFSKRYDVPLPVDRNIWNTYFDKFKKASQDGDTYDKASAITIHARHALAGHCEIRCERPFVPLGWRHGRNTHGPWAQLDDNIGPEDTSIELRSFEKPQHPLTISIPDNHRIFGGNGGLLAARHNAFAAYTILPPPTAPTFEELRASSKFMSKGPELWQVSLKVPAIKDLIDLSLQWKDAEVPANPQARTYRNSVLRSCTASISVSICGKRWAKEERKHWPKEDLHVHELQNALTDKSLQKALVTAINKRMRNFNEWPPEDRPLIFKSVFSDIRAHQYRRGRLNDRKPINRDYAEFLLRLASAPWSISGHFSEGYIVPYLEATIDDPLPLRVARYLTKLSHARLYNEESEPHFPEDVYRGWTWL